MLKDANFLCEIGTEEIPAGYMLPAIEATTRIFIKTLDDNRINHGELDVCATPRRIAVAISSLADTQREEEAEVKGPAVKAAYDAQGNPTRALEGFLAGNGVTRDDVFTRDTGKGEYVFARKKLEARKTAEIIPGILNDIVNTIPFPKRMRWSDKSVTFPRPVRYFLVLFNNALIPYEIEGISSSTMTRGHYIQHNDMIEIGNIKDYEDVLASNAVIVDHRVRKERIRERLMLAASACGGVVLEDEELLDTVTFLVEDPNIVTCTFDPDYLKIPDIALIAEMKEHQKYFPVMDKRGKLTNNFLVVSNNPSNENVIEGNRRVVTARFNDASFFFHEDRKMKLVDRVDALKHVLFHKELGSIYQKVERMQKIASVFAEKLGLAGDVAKKIDRAVLLSKTDLETAMVYEFTSLQGQMGRIYALMDGEDPEVAAAIEEHYKPKFQGDPLPESMVSVITSLAEKIDNIFGSFSVGNIPKGSQDPYALRRQANAIVEMIIRNDINVSLKEVYEAVASAYKDGASLVDKIVEFTAARAKTIFSDRGLNYDEIDACLSTGGTDYTELMRRAKSINDFRKNEKFSEMLLGFKRMNNIVSAFRKENGDYSLAFNESVLKEGAEKALYEFFKTRREAIASAIAASRYIELFELLISGKSIIDDFFDSVLVMEKDVSVRDNRLALLEMILDNFTGLLDFSKISDK
ncbi:MAG TPA: glycine--tRNA ligase subunit beta [Spirochaetota bacterium]|nr:glycine--tRNA ligase subunit beta [Spirochaetota bacterium]HPI90433.1 glycine--tRNA ligase subunit beta [Spirochaetota bacterium]HPR46559.1 glycine--tRNA ligase subunit beta [Spirochaetota bacterium]